LDPELQPSNRTLSNSGSGSDSDDEEENEDDAYDRVESDSGDKDPEHNRMSMTAMSSPASPSAAVTVPAPGNELSSLIGSMSTAAAAAAVAAATRSRLVVVKRRPRTKKEHRTLYDVTPYLCLSQSEAARRLNIPVSTLSKRWREVNPNRKWPYRTVCKLDRELTTLLHNLTQSERDGTSPINPSLQSALSTLLARREEQLRPVQLRLYRPPPRPPGDVAHLQLMPPQTQLPPPQQASSLLQ